MRGRIPALPPTAKRAEMLDGVPGAIDRESRGVKGVSGEAAVAALKAQIERLRLIKMKGKLVRRAR